VVTNARALDDRPPSADLWPAVAARIGLSSRARPVVRRFSFTVPQLAAASVVLALLSGGAAWLIVRRGSVPTPPVVTSGRAPALPARHGDSARDREEPENHRPGDPQRPERACGRPREFISEPAPRPGDAAETGAPPPSGDTRRRAELGGG